MFSAILSLTFMSLVDGPPMSSKVRMPRLADGAAPRSQSPRTPLMRPVVSLPSAFSAPLAMGESEATTQTERKPNELSNKAMDKSVDLARSGTAFDLLAGNAGHNQYRDPKDGLDRIGQGGKLIVPTSKPYVNFNFTHKGDVGPSLGPNGCGTMTGLLTPRILPQTPFGADFRSGCNNHDLCYEDLAKSRGYCDAQMFKENWKACTILDSFSARTGCYATATAYYGALRLGGQSAYDQAQRDAAQRAIQTGRMIDGMASGVAREEGLIREIEKGATAYRSDRATLEAQRLNSQQREAVGRVESVLEAVRREQAETAEKEALIGEIRAAAERARHSPSR